MPVVDGDLGLYVHGVGHFNPENVIDNKFLEDLDIGTNDEWIVERVGIHRRRTVLPLDYIRETKNADPKGGYEAALYDNAETGKRAALLAIERAGIKPTDVGMVIAGGCTPSMLIPADACRIAAALDLEVPAFDINSACSSFGAQLHLLASLSGLPDYVLVVNTENTTRAVDYRDRAAAVLWGDGSSAAVVSRKVRSKVKVVQTTLDSSPAGAGHVIIPRFGHFFQNGGQVQRFAIKTTQMLIEAMLPAARERAVATGGTVRFIGHQANLLMLEGVTQRVGIEDAEHWHNVREFGNTAAAGAPTVLSMHWSELAPGDTLLMAVVGSGLTWASLRFDVTPS